MISVIIPVYNVEKYILRCLQSVADQTYEGDMECIIVDDCGSDTSIDIAKRFIHNNKSNVKFNMIHHEHNRGLAAARNTGIANASGDFVMHLDSDDWLELEALELLANKQLVTNADIVSGNALAHYDNSEKILEEPDYKDNLDMVYGTIKMTPDHVMWRRIIRKNLYTDYNISAEEGINIGEDHHTLPRLAFYAKSIAKVNSVIYHYNCKNTNSYMHMSRNKINLVHYRNNIRSIQILKEFFLNKDTDISDELDKIREIYEYRMRYNAVALGDKNSYYFFCNIHNALPKYYLLRIQYLLGNVKSCITNLIR